MTEQTAKLITGFRKELHSIQASHTDLLTLAEGLSQRLETLAAQWDDDSATTRNENAALAKALHSFNTRLSALESSLTALTGSSGQPQP